MSGFGCQGVVVKVGRNGRRVVLAWDRRGKWWWAGREECFEVPMMALFGNFGRLSDEIIIVDIQELNRGEQLRWKRTILVLQVIYPPWRFGDKQYIWQELGRSICCDRAVKLEYLNIYSHFLQHLSKYKKQMPVLKAMNLHLWNQSGHIWDGQLHPYPNR